MAKKKESIQIEIPFGKAGDPVFETSQFGRIPEGTYLATIFAITTRETNAGDPMISLDLRIDSSPAKRKHVSDMFVIQSGKGASLFAVQRLHGVLVASGIKQQEKTISSNALIKNLTGRQLVIEVVDHEIPETEEYEARKTSKPSSYYRLDSEEADRVEGAEPADDGALGEEEGEEGDVSGDGDGCDDEDCDIDDCDGDHEEEEEARPKRKAKKSKGKKKGSKKSKKSSSDDDDGDDGDFDDKGGDDDDDDGELEED